MSAIDWVVLFGTLGLIVAYGSWKTRKNKNLESYLKGNNAENWMTIGLSIMATQASAITAAKKREQAVRSTIKTLLLGTLPAQQAGSITG